MSVEIPNPKHQIPNKLQTPNLNGRQSAARPHWFLWVGVCLGFGVWDVVFCSGVSDLEF